MSGSFSGDWLALREPADAAARNTQVMAAAANYLAGLDNPHICDLACGTGSTVRGLAPMLGDRQNWQLVDKDAGLLARARETMTAWADQTVDHSADLVIRKDGKHIVITFRQADLHGNPSPWFPGTNLVTASALFDLVSPRWMEALVAELVRDDIPLLALLTYDGRAAVVPRHANDDRILAAFHRHQSRDKGFGAAAGPKADACLSGLFSDRGWRVERHKSDWQLNSAQSQLMNETTAGWLSAAAEEGLDAAMLEEWREYRSHALRALHVGHRDIFACPPGDPAMSRRKSQSKRTSPVGRG